MAGRDDVLIIRSGSPVLSTFTRVGLYVFVDGCYWHGCPEHFVVPKTRTDFWLQKIEGNRARDEDTDRRLASLGLTSLRIWEHDPAPSALEQVLTVYTDLRSMLRGAGGSNETETETTDGNAGSNSCVRARVSGGQSGGGGI